MVKAPEAALWPKVAPEVRMASTPRSVSRCSARTAAEGCLTMTTRLPAGMFELAGMYSSGFCEPLWMRVEEASTVVRPASRMKRS